MRHEARCRRRRAARLDLLRRRHALADAAGAGRARCWPRPSGCGASRRTSRSRSRPIPRRSRRRNFADLAAAGVNRVSLGLQALDDEALRFLGRLHNAQEGLAALETAQAAFERVSFDLIYARPGQTPEQWRARADARARLRHRAPVALPADDRARHALRHRCAPGRVRAARRRSGGRPVRAHPRADRRGGPAGLRSQQPCAARRGEPAQPHLLALPGLRRHRPGRARAARRDGDACGTRSPRTGSTRSPRNGHGLAEERALGRASRPPRRC